MREKKNKKLYQKEKYEKKKTKNRNKSFASIRSSLYFVGPKKSESGIRRICDNKSTWERLCKRLPTMATFGFRSTNK